MIFFFFFFLVFQVFFFFSRHFHFRFKVKVIVSVIQLRLTLCDPLDCILWDSSAHGILQARILERIAIPFFRVFSWLGLLHCRQILYCLCHQGSPTSLSYFPYIWHRFMREYIYSIVHKVPDFSLEGSTLKTYILKSDKWYIFLFIYWECISNSTTLWNMSAVVQHKSPNVR